MLKIFKTLFLWDFFVFLLLISLCMPFKNLHWQRGKLEKNAYFFLSKFSAYFDKDILISRRFKEKNILMIFVSVHISQKKQNYNVI